MSDDDWASLSRGRYLCLESFRRDGTAVRTPLWFAAVPGGTTLVAYTIADSAKVKRLRRNPSCRIATCDMRGNPGGPFLAARATLRDDDPAAMRLLNRKYWPWKLMLDVFARFRRRAGRVVITISPAPG
jgi:PPOX class probable F420-dependent enzyme